jgi:trk system potassium uptake protein TrkH
MRPRHVIRLVGLFLILFSLTMLPPAAIAMHMADGQISTFLESFALLAVSGALLWYPYRTCRGNLHTRETFLVVALFWLLLGTLGSLPLLLGTNLGVTDAVFEAISGFTATGATVITGLQDLPPSILIYRQQLQWYGGLGIVVLAVAILPMLGVGGMQLYRAETAGPLKDEKITPRVIQTARFMLLIYIGLTIACASAYWLAGMEAFDALAHSFSTVSTGGFSTHDESLGWFDNSTVEMIAIVFMLIGAISFNTHFLAAYRLGPAAYWRDTQTRAFLGIIAVLIMLTMILLMMDGRDSDAARTAAFQVVSVVTTTGFVTEDFTGWPFGLPLILIFASFIGGCAGSTSGGLKVIRIVVLFKVGLREMRRLVHPQLVQPIRLGSRAVGPEVPDAIWGFFSVYVLTFAVFMIAVMATGIDHITAFGAVATSINNFGPGLGEAASTFQPLNDTAKWLCAFAMLLGRLEIFTLLVLLTPGFWRR